MSTDYNAHALAAVPPPGGCASNHRQHLPFRRATEGTATTAVPRRGGFLVKRLAVVLMMLGAFAGLGWLSTTEALAADWTGGSNTTGNWSDPANWSGNTVPANG